MPAIYRHGMVPKYVVSSDIVIVLRVSQLWVGTWTHSGSHDTSVIVS
jgi:hypothetical protein